MSAVQWREHLIAEHGVHPEIAIWRFQACIEQGLVRRIAASSLPQAVSCCHGLRGLDAADSNPLAGAIHLHCEDVLIQGKASRGIDPGRGKRRSQLGGSSARPIGDLSEQQPFT